MAVVNVVSMRIAEEQQEESLADALNMVVEKGVNRRTAQRVRRGAQVYASLMEVDLAVSMLAARRVPRAVLISANPMVVAKDARTPTAPRVPREPLYSAKAMEEESVVQLKVAQKVYMEVHNPVLSMEVAKGAYLKDAPRALEAVLITVLVMVGARDAYMLGVTRARREAPTFARRMEEANVARGATQGPTSEPAALLVIALQEARKACAFITTRSWMMIVSTVAERWVLSVLQAPLLPLTVRTTLQTLKLGGTAFPCSQRRLLAVCRALFPRAGCTAATSYLCFPTVCASGRNPATTLRPAPQHLATTPSLLRDSVPLVAAAGSSAQG